MPVSPTSFVFCSSFWCVWELYAFANCLSRSWILEASCSPPSGRRRDVDSFNCFIRFSCSWSCKTDATGLQYREPSNYVLHLLGIISRCTLLDHNHASMAFQYIKADVTSHKDKTWLFLVAHMSGWNSQYLVTKQQVLEFELTAAENSGFKIFTAMQVSEDVLTASRKWNWV